MPGPLGQAVLAAALLLAVGLALRAGVGLLRILYVPASVVAGLIGLIVLQTAGHGVWPFGSAAVAGAVKPIAAEWLTWPGVLIAVVFAGLLLEPPGPGGFAAAMKRGARSGVLAWIIILGQIAIGLTVYLLAVRPDRPDVPASFGQLLEVSWAGGFGSATGMGAVYAGQNFPEGRDLAFFLATVGLVYGVLSGLVFVNVAIRRGWLAKASDLAATDAAAGEKTGPAVRSEMIEPLAVQVIVLAAAFGVGVLLQQGFTTLTALIISHLADDGDARRQAIAAVGNVPLFLFTLLAGGLVRRAMAGLGLARFIDTVAIGRLLGVAMEFLIVSGIATMRLEAVGRFGWPLLWLLAGAAGWSVVCLFVLSPRLLPRRYWFELGLLNFGFSTANTPQGMMLLRIVDPLLRTGAAADYAVAAPLSAPFVGGGIVTFLLMPVLLARVPAGLVLAGLVGLMVGFYAIGRRLGRGERDAVVNLGKG